MNIKWKLAESHSGMPRFIAQVGRLRAEVAAHQEHDFAVEWTARVEVVPVHSREPVRLEYTVHRTLDEAQSDCAEVIARFCAPGVEAERERAAAELAVLTERMETEIAEACAAVRARTIEECAAVLDAERRRYDLLAAAVPAPDRADCRSHAFVVVVMAEKLRALAAPTPTTEPATVDPAAGALR
jgi:hypothetical protein